jgi:hypothetical protein
MRIRIQKLINGAIFMLIRIQKPNNRRGINADPELKLNTYFLRKAARATVNFC